jgi:hypothetical protein
MYSTWYSSQILTEFEFSRKILQKYSNTKFYENPSSGSWLVPHEQSKPTAAFRNFAIAPKDR